MVTILVSGSGTGVGKTRVTAALARLAARQGRSVQIIKPVQTGVTSGQTTDADEAAALAGISPGAAHTLRRYPAALAPMAAAKAVGAGLEMATVIDEIRKLPPVDIRLIEGAGGLAVPLTNSGYDWGDFAALLEINALVLVVPDQLGAINQARLLYHYYRHKNTQAFLADWTGASRANLSFLQKLSPALVDKAPGGIFFNALSTPPPEVAASTREGLRDCQIPLWGELGVEALEPRLHPPLVGLFGLN